MIQNLLYCFNVLVCKTISQKGAYIVNKDPESVKFLYQSVLAKLPSEHQQLKNLYTNHEEMYNCNTFVLWGFFLIKQFMHLLTNNLPF